VENKRSVERLVVEVPHRQHRCLRSVHLEDPLMKVAKGLARYGPIALGLELAAAAARPIVAQVRAAAVVGFEIDLDDLAGGVAADHHVVEHRLLNRQWNLEQGVVVDERDVDSAGIVAVRVHDRVLRAAAKSRAPCPPAPDGRPNAPASNNSRSGTDWPGDASLSLPIRT
jgi:hypothetical protein